MKVYVAQPIQPNGIKILEEIAEVKAQQSGRPSTREEFLREINDVDAVILPWQTEVMDIEALDVAKNLKIIGRQGVGYENIDLKTSTQKGVYVTYTPIHIPTVADIAMGLMLSAARKIILADRFVKDKMWEIGGEWVPLKFLGFDIHHKTIGIIGCGRIGAEIAKRAKGFDMVILYYDILENKAIERKLGARRVSLEKLLRESDFIHVNCNLTSDTKGLLSEREFGLMKKTAFIVNTARGPVIDQKALYNALKAQSIAGAGLDVFEEEPISADDPLLELDNVVLVPHIGSAAFETRQKMADIVCRDVVNVLTGKVPTYLLNPDVLKVRPLAH
jgi:D-3-phosphoglycerate dehydrogenase